MNKLSYLKDAVFLLIYIFTGHSSIVTTEIYAKFSLRQLRTEFPLLVNNTKNTKNQEVLRTSTIPVDSIISGLKTSQR